MKLAISHNNNSPVIAEVTSSGYLGVHLNLRRSDENTESGSLKISGYDLTDEESTKSIEWTGFEVQANDTIQIEVSPKGQASDPESTRFSNENKAYQNLSEEQAIKLLKEFKGQESALIATLDHAKTSLGEDDAKQLSIFIGHVLAAYYQKLLTPIYRSHPMLIPHDLKGFSL